MADLLFKVAPNIVFGSYISSRIGLYAKGFGNRFMVILDPVLKEVQKIDTLFESLSIRGVEYFIFDDVDFSSDSETVKHGLELARTSHAQGVIAIGGSSVLGIARSVCALYNEHGEVYDFLDGDVPASEPLPLIAVPSTIRSPFLFTDIIPITDARSRQLKMMRSQNALCKLAVFDPNLHASLTPNQIGAIALETLCIAVEAYLSQKANFFSDTFAEKAIELLGVYLQSAENDTTTVEPELLITQSGCLASLAISSSSAGPATLIGLTVCSRYKVIRALTTTILLPYLLEDGATFKRDKIVRIAELLGISSVEGKDKIVALLAEKVRHWIALAKLPARLKDLSLSMEQFTIAAEDACQLEITNGMPRSMGAEDFFELMKLAY